MRRPRAFIFLSVGLFVTSLLASPSADAAKRLPCSKKGSKTLAANEHIRVFKTERPTPEELYPVWRLYGCVYARGRHVLLDDNTDSGGEVDPIAFRLAGRMAGVAVIHWYGTVSMARIATWDLNRGQTVHATELHVSTSGFPSSDPMDLEITDRGSMAYTTGEAEAGWKVHKHDAGAAAVLDSGKDIDPDSLAITGPTVYWTKGGHPRSATLSEPGGSSIGTKTGQSDARCSLKGSETIAASPVGRVYVRDSPRESRVFGCLYERDKPFVIAKLDDRSILGPVRMAGRFVAFGISSDGRTARTVRVDLRSGKRRTPGPVIGGFRDTAKITDLELKPNGSFAWLFTLTPCPEPCFPPEQGIWKYDNAGFARIDEARAIDHSSLAVSGSILYWTKGGQPYSASLN
jgi:hypothetical protein